MYVRKYPSHKDAPQEEPLSIPENYVGNAFKHIEEPTPYPERGVDKEEKERCKSCEQPISPTRAELLPVILSVLLSESKEHEDIATILLFLLLL